MITASVLAAAEVLPPGPFPEEARAALEKILGWAAGLVGLACLAKVLFVGARLAWDRQHTAGIESTSASELLTAMVAWLLAAAACTGIAAALIP